MAGMAQNERIMRTLAPILPPNSTTKPTTMATTIDHTISPSFSHHPLSHHQFNPSPSSSGAGERAATHPQWAHHETLELISVRGELEREFTASKRNKVLWETVATRMKERGFSRTPDQCKCKWKNLVNRYQGKETSDADDGRQCPFFEELHAIFSERARNLQQSLIVPQRAIAQSRKKIKSTSGGQYSDDFSEDEGDEGEDSGGESIRRSSNARKRKAEREKHVQATDGDESAGPNSAGVGNTSGSSSIQEVLRVFFQQQQRIEMQWRESMERHRHEREIFEREWRESMEKLERERLMVEQEWREREEQRKMREEIRAEKRDALLTTLLNKLISEDHL